MSDFLIITGLSGAGRSTVADALEDMDWFVIDNLPPELISKVSELVQRPGSQNPRVVLGVGAGAFGDEFESALVQLRESGASVRVLFLEASDSVLVRRYEGTRRRHPLESGGLSDAVERERELLTPVKALADVILDTSSLNVHQLRHKILELFGDSTSDVAMRTSVMSFGYKYGLPLDVDMVLDCRFLPNPYWEQELRPLSGLDEPVRRFVLGRPETGDFLERLGGLLDVLLPAFLHEGKAYLTIAVGCTGGRHRSVVLSQEIAKRIKERGFEPSVSHRDIDK